MAWPLLQVPELIETEKGTLWYGACVSYEPVATHDDEERHATAESDPMCALAGRETKEPCDHVP